jgi:hypothetical protein
MQTISFLGLATDSDYYNNNALITNRSLGQLRVIQSDTESNLAYLVSQEGDNNLLLTKG